MDISFDPAKNARNIEERGLSFEDFTGFDADPAVVVDDRYDYGETRFRAFGRIDGLGFCLHRNGHRHPHHQLSPGT